MIRVQYRLLLIPFFQTNLIILIITVFDGRPPFFTKDLLRILSEKGSSISQYFLGEMYLEGMGVLQDFSLAHMWFNIAASQGHKKARVYRDRLTKKMGADQIAEAQKLARECMATDYKSC